MSARNRLPIPIAPQNYNQVNEEQARKSIADRLGSIESEVEGGIATLPDVYSVIAMQTLNRAQVGRLIDAEIAVVSAEIAWVKHRLFGGL
jgi:hypothetical protein